MATVYDSKKAAQYILDPLTGTAPNEETGPGAHFGSTMPTSSTQGISPNGLAMRERNGPTVHFEEPSKEPSTTTNPFRHAPPSSSADVPVSHSRQASNSSNGTSARNAVFPPHGDGASSAYSDDNRRRSGDHGRRSAEYLSNDMSKPGRQRGGSLTERFPGDMTVRPLDMIRKENRHADHAPHLKKKHIPGTDPIDLLDDAAGSRYHHGGPFDAALLARNNSYKSSPVAALETSNLEALKATPTERIQDSLRDHRPLDGTAAVPPGATDAKGRIYDYQEGEDMMIEGGGNYQRWPGVDYEDSDIKGHGIPSYEGEIDRGILREQDVHSEQQAISSSRQLPVGERHGEVIELTERPHAKSTEGRHDINPPEIYAESESSHQQHDSATRRLSVGIKKTIGSLRRKDK